MALPASWSKHQQIPVHTPQRTSAHKTILYHTHRSCLYNLLIWQSCNPSCEQFGLEAGWQLLIDMELHISKYAQLYFYPTFESREADTESLSSSNHSHPVAFTSSSSIHNQWNRL